MSHNINGKLKNKGGLLSDETALLGEVISPHFGQTFTPLSIGSPHFSHL